MSYSLWGCQESDTTVQLSMHAPGVWARCTCRTWRVSWQGRGPLWPTAGARTLVVEDSREYFWRELSWKSCLGTKTWPHSTACRLQCWDTSGQTTNRVETQPHSSTERLPQVILSPQPPRDMPPDTALHTRVTKSSSTHQWAGTSASHHEVCTSPGTKRTLLGLSIREMQINTTMRKNKNTIRYHLTLRRMAIIKKIYKQ